MHSKDSHWLEVMGQDNPERGKRCVNARHPGGKLPWNWFGIGLGWAVMNKAQLPPRFG